MSSSALWVWNVFHDFEGIQDENSPITDCSRPRHRWPRVGPDSPSDSCRHPGGRPCGRRARCPAQGGSAQDADARARPQGCRCCGADRGRLDDDAGGAHGCRGGRLQSQPRKRGSGRASPQDDASPPWRPPHAQASAGKGGSGFLLSAASGRDAGLSLVGLGGERVGVELIRRQARQAGVVGARRIHHNGCAAGIHLVA